VLLSIDGRRETTDHCRGTGVHDRVVEAASWLRSLGFRGDLIARMTVSESSNIYLDVRHLLSLGLFNHIHWQLNAVWSQSWRDFEGWAEASYLPGLYGLIDLWLREAEKGVVLGLIPILGILRSAISGNPMPRPPCGAGVNALAISTDGRVLACPIALEEPWAELGDVRRDRWRDSLGRVGIGKPCTRCRYLRYCGGRCLYAHKERLWGEEGFRALCWVTISTIERVLRIEERITQLLKEGVIEWKSLNYPTCNNSTEIIP